MLERLTNRLCLTLTPSSLTLLQIKPRQAIQVLHATDGQTLITPESLGQVLQAALQKVSHSGLHLSVILADAWMRYFITTPPSNGTRLRDCEIAAAVRFEQLYGESAQGWRLDADWHAASPFATCAMPDWLGKTIQQCAAQQRCVVTDVVPQFVSAWNQHCRRLLPDAWFGVVRDETLTIGVCESARIIAMRSTPLLSTVSTTTQWIADYVSRYALVSHRALPEQLQLCGDVPPAWLAVPIFRCSVLDSKLVATAALLPNVFSVTATAPHS